MDRIILIVAFLMLIGCEKNSDFTRNNNKTTATYIKNNTFIKSTGIYYFNNVDIVVKQLNDGAIIYGVFDINNNLLYQRNINSSISNNMKWAIYTDSDNHIWFYNADYQEINLLIIDGLKANFIKDKNKLPKTPIELSKFIKE